MEEATPRGFLFHDYPAFSLWAGYLILKSELDSKPLFEEINRVFEKVLDELAVSESEKNLLELYRDHELLQKLFALEVTRKEWNRALYRREWIQPKVMTSRMRKLASESRLPQAPIEKGFNPLTFKQVFETAFEFYRLAREREGAFYESIDREMTRTKKEKAVLVTGGFHTDGIMDLFREEEVNYSVLMPKLTRELDTENYVENMLEAKPTMFDLATLEMILYGQDRPSHNQQSPNKGNLIVGDLVQSSLEYYLDKFRETGDVRATAENVTTHTNESTTVGRKGYAGIQPATVIEEGQRTPQKVGVYYQDREPLSRTNKNGQKQFFTIPVRSVTANDQTQGDLYRPNGNWVNADRVNLGKTTDRKSAPIKRFPQANPDLGSRFGRADARVEAAFRMLGFSMDTMKLSEISDPEQPSIIEVPPAEVPSWIPRFLRNLVQRGLNFWTQKKRDETTLSRNEAAEAEYEAQLATAKTAKQKLPQLRRTIDLKYQELRQFYESERNRLEGYYGKEYMQENEEFAELGKRLQQLQAAYKIARNYLSISPDSNAVSLLDEAYRTALSPASTETEVTPRADLLALMQEDAQEAVAQLEQTFATSLRALYQSTPYSQRDKQFNAARESLIEAFVNWVAPDVMSYLSELWDVMSFVRRLEEQIALEEKQALLGGLWNQLASIENREPINTALLERMDSTMQAEENESNPMKVRTFWEVLLAEYTDGGYSGEDETQLQRKIDLALVQHNILNREKEGEDLTSNFLALYGAISMLPLTLLSNVEREELLWLRREVKDLISVDSSERVIPENLYAEYLYRYLVLGLRHLAGHAENPSAIRLRASILLDEIEATINEVSPQRVSELMGQAERLIVIHDIFAELRAATRARFSSVNPLLLEFTQRVLEKEGDISKKDYDIIQTLFHLPRPIIYTGWIFDFPHEQQETQDLVNEPQLVQVSVSPLSPLSAIIDALPLSEDPSYAFASSSREFFLGLWGISKISDFFRSFLDMIVFSLAEMIRILGNLASFFLGVPKIFQNEEKSVESESLIGRQIHQFFQANSLVLSRTEARTQSSRRDFLKVSALTAGAAYTSTLIPGLTEAAERPLRSLREMQKVDVRRLNAEQLQTFLEDITQYYLDILKKPKTTVGLQTIDRRLEYRAVFELVAKVLGRSRELMLTFSETKEVRKSLAEMKKRVPGDTTDSSVRKKRKENYFYQKSAQRILQDYIFMLVEHEKIHKRGVSLLTALIQSSRDVAQEELKLLDSPDLAVTDKTTEAEIPGIYRKRAKIAARLRSYTLTIQFTGEELVHNATWGADAKSMNARKSFMKNIYLPYLQDSLGKKGPREYEPKDLDRYFNGILTSYKKVFNNESDLMKGVYTEVVAGVKKGRIEYKRVSNDAAVVLAPSVLNELNKKGIVGNELLKKLEQKKRLGQNTREERKEILEELKFYNDQETQREKNAEANHKLNVQQLQDEIDALQQEIDSKEREIRPKDKETVGLRAAYLNAQKDFVAGKAEEDDVRKARDALEKAEKEKKDLVDKRTEKNRALSKVKNEYEKKREIKKSETDRYAAQRLYYEALVILRLKGIISRSDARNVVSSVEPLDEDENKFRIFFSDGREPVVAELLKKGGSNWVYRAETQEGKALFLKVSVSPEDNNRAAAQTENEAYISNLLKPHMEGVSKVIGGVALGDNSGRYAVLIEGEADLKDLSAWRDQMSAGQRSKTMALVVSRVREARKVPAYEGKGVAVHDIQPGNVLLILEEVDGEVRVKDIVLIDLPAYKTLVKNSEKKDAWLLDRRYRILEPTLVALEGAEERGVIDRATVFGHLSLLELLSTSYEFVFRNLAIHGGQAAVEAFVAEFEVSKQPRVRQIITEIESLEALRYKEAFEIQAAFDIALQNYDVEQALETLQRLLEELAALGENTQAPTQAEATAESLPYTLEPRLNLDQVLDLVREHKRQFPGRAFPEGAYVNAENYPIQDLVLLELDSAVTGDPGLEEVIPKVRALYTLLKQLDPNRKVEPIVEVALQRAWKELKAQREEGENRQTSIEEALRVIREKSWESGGGAQLQLNAVENLQKQATEDLSGFEKAVEQIQGARELSDKEKRILSGVVAYSKEKADASKESYEVDARYQAAAAEVTQSFSDEGESSEEIQSAFENLTRAAILGEDLERFAKEFLFELKGFYDRVTAALKQAGVDFNPREEGSIALLQKLSLAIARVEARKPAKVYDEMSDVTKLRMAGVFLEYRYNKTGHSALWKADVKTAVGAELQWVDRSDLPYPDAPVVAIFPEALSGIELAPLLVALGKLEGVNFVIIPPIKNLRYGKKDDGTLFLERGAYLDKNGNLVLGKFRDPLPVHFLLQGETSLPKIKNVLASPQFMKLVNDKITIGKFLQSIGARIPETLFVEEKLNRQQAEALIRRFAKDKDYIAIKPHDLFGGRGIKIFSNKALDKAVDHFMELQETSPELVLQERIYNKDWIDAESGEAIDENLRVIATWDGNEVIIDEELTLVRYVVGNWADESQPVNTKVGAETVSLREYFELREAADPSFGRIGFLDRMKAALTEPHKELESYSVEQFGLPYPGHRYSGIVGWDLIEGADGNFYIIEPNAGALGGIATLETKILKSNDAEARLGNAVRPISNFVSNLASAAQEAQAESSDEEPGDYVEVEFTPLMGRILGRGLLYSKQFKQARDLYQSLYLQAQSNRDKTALFLTVQGIADASIGLGEPEAALAAYAEFIKTKAPENTAARFEMVTLLLDEKLWKGKARSDEAEVILNEILKLATGSVTDRKKAEALIKKIQNARTEARAGVLGLEVYEILGSLRATPAQLLKIGNEVVPGNGKRFRELFVNLLALSAGRVGKFGDSDEAIPDFIQQKLLERGFDPQTQTVLIYDFHQTQFLENESLALGIGVNRYLYLIFEEGKLVSYSMNANSDATGVRFSSVKYKEKVAKQPSRDDLARQAWEPVTALIKAEERATGNKTGITSEDVFLLRGADGQVILLRGRDERARLEVTVPASSDAAKLLVGNNDAVLNQLKPGSHVLSTNAASPKAIENAGFILPKGTQISQLPFLLEYLQNADIAFAKTSVKEGRITDSIRYTRGAVVTKAAVSWKDIGAEVTDREDVIDAANFALGELAFRDLIHTEGKGGQVRVFYYIEAFPPAVQKEKQPKVSEPDIIQASGDLRLPARGFPGASESLEFLRRQGRSYVSKLTKILNGNGVNVKRKRDRVNNLIVMDVGQGSSSHEAFFKQVGNDFVLVGIFHKDQQKLNSAVLDYLAAVNDINPQELPLEDKEVSDQTLREQLNLVISRAEGRLGVETSSVAARQEVAYAVNNRIANQFEDHVHAPLRQPDLAWLDGERESWPMALQVTGGLTFGILFVIDEGTSAEEYAALLATYITVTAQAGLTDAFLKVLDVLESSEHLTRNEAQGAVQLVVDEEPSEIFLRSLAVFLISQVNQQIHVIWNMGNVEAGDAYQANLAFEDLLDELRQVQDADGNAIENRLEIEATTGADFNLAMRKSTNELFSNARTRSQISNMEFYQRLAQVIIGGRRESIRAAVDEVRDSSQGTILFAVVDAENTYGTQVAVVSVGIEVSQDAEEIDEEDNQMLNKQQQGVYEIRVSFLGGLIDSLQRTMQNALQALIAA